MNNTQFVLTIKDLCKKNDIAITTLLEKCSLRKGLIYDVEKRNAKPSIEIIEKIANYFEVSIDYLLGRTNDYTKITGSTIVAEKIKDTNIQSDIIEDTSIMGVNIENTNIGNTHKKNNTEQAITENEAELLKNYRFLSDRNKHKLITISYEMQDEINSK